MGGLRSAVDELAGQQLGVVDAADLAELRELRQRLEAEWLRRVAAFDRQEGYALEGAGSAAAWLRWRLRLTPGAAREQVTLADSNSCPRRRPRWPVGRSATPTPG